MPPLLYAYQYLAKRWIKSASIEELKSELSSARNSPTLAGEGISLLLQTELRLREFAAKKSAE